MIETIMTNNIFAPSFPTMSTMSTIPNITIESEDAFIPAISTISTVPSICIEPDMTCVPENITESCSSSSSSYEAFFLGVTLLFITVATIAIVVAGARNSWYTTLNTGSTPIWVGLTVWSLATLVAYVGLFLFYLNTCHRLTLVVLFLIGELLTLAWVSIFFYGQNLVLSLWSIAIVFVYMFSVFIYMWYITPSAAIFLLPLLATYLYMFYSVIHLANLNNVPL